jgi:NAD(P)-dependent dehydrogenase (short-subunit alcohol dehydrogenase family)
MEIAAALVAEGARVAIADKDESGLAKVSGTLGVPAMLCDVTREQDIEAVISDVQQRPGPIDLSVSNAGAFHGQPGHAASASYAGAGPGGFVQIAAAAGLLSQIGDAAYSATKYAAVSFAESLAISHGAAGLHVSDVCPQYVAAGMLALCDGDAAEHESLLTADQVAHSVLQGIRVGRFRILPHPDVARFAHQRAQDPERWIARMQALTARAEG